MTEESLSSLGLAARLGLAGIAISLAWVALTVLFWQATKLSRAQGHERIELVGRCLIITTLLTCVVITVVLPILAPRLDSSALTTQWIHRCGVVLLGGFLCAALYFQIETIVKQKRSASMASIGATYRRWLWLTEIMPAPAAIMLFFTGFNRIFGVPGYSINSTWLLGLVSVLGIMMADGIFGYSPAVRKLARIADATSDTTKFFSVSHDPCRDLKFLLHALSFPLVLLLPIWRIGPNWSPVTPIFRYFDFDPVTGGWRQLLPAIGLFAILFGITAGLNRLKKD
jgi:hypothetical protein